MTRLYDDPTRFSGDMLAGFLDLYPEHVAGVRGGVVRAQETPPGKVAVVVGGGSGHYPAFCGVVGPGFADGAVVGNIFTSPSSADAHSVGRAAAGDGGLLFLTGNYAGDVMNFDLARDRLVAEGVDTRAVYVTDDVASAPAAERERRRGIAGDFVVFKAAGAAAEAGAPLDEVERVARTANARTSTMGVGLSGCTMPGADGPLFRVAAGTMGVGLGIHGEPGIADQPLPRASDLARLLVDSVLAEAPQDTTGRVAVVLNGLGCTKYEELFVLWRSVASLLRERGYSVIRPEVGELVTSLDMGGVSLTVTHLDDELEAHWLAPADTPAFRRGALADGYRQRRGPARNTRDNVTARRSAPRETATRAASEASRAAARFLVERLGLMHRALRDAEVDLGRMDAVAGDGDHGRGMVKGADAALAAATATLERGGGAGAVLVAAGDAWAAEAGGTSGVLWGAGLRAAGATIDDDAAVDACVLAPAVAAAAEAIRRLGKAQVGDKTLVDALAPFVTTVELQIADGADAATAWWAATEAAEAAAAGTARLRPQLGRARPLAERSVGTPDPGATSLALCARAVGTTPTTKGP